MVQPGAVLRTDSKISLKLPPLGSENLLSASSDGDILNKFDTGEGTLC